MTIIRVLDQQIGKIEANFCIVTEERLMQRQLPNSALLALHAGGHWFEPSTAHCPEFVCSLRIRRFEGFEITPGPASAVQCHERRWPDLK